MGFKVTIALSLPWIISMTILFRKQLGLPQEKIFVLAWVKNDLICDDVVYERLLMGFRVALVLSNAVLRP